MKKILSAVLLSTMSMTSFAQVTGSIESKNGVIEFSNSNNTISLSVNDCQPLAAKTSFNNVILKGYDTALNPIPNRTTEIVFEDGSSCLVSPNKSFSQQMTNMSVMLGSSASVAPITAEDVFSRQYVTAASDLSPVINSKRPSVALLLVYSVNAQPKNELLCESFKKLEKTEVVSKRVAITEQVVTKWPMTRVPKMFERETCKKLLELYNYKIAENQLNRLNTELLNTSNGPFVAVYNPGSTKIDHLIDLNGATEAQIKSFGKNWDMIFTDFSNNPNLETVTNVQSSGNLKNSATTLADLWSGVYNFLKTTVCIIDPNLAYLVHEGVGKVLDGAVCLPANKS